MRRILNVMTSIRGAIEEEALSIIGCMLFRPPLIVGWPSWRASGQEGGAKR